MATWDLQRGVIVTPVEEQVLERGKGTDGAITGSPEEVLPSRDLANRELLAARRGVVMDVFEHGMVFVKWVQVNRGGTHRRIAGGKQAIQVSAGVQGKVSFLGVIALDVDRRKGVDVAGVERPTRHQRPSAGLDTLKQVVPGLVGRSLLGWCQSADLYGYVRYGVAFVVDDAAAHRPASFEVKLAKVGLALARHSDIFDLSAEVARVVDQDAVSTGWDRTNAELARVIGRSG